MLLSINLMTLNSKSNTLLGNIFSERSDEFLSKFLYFSQTKKLPPKTFTQRTYFSEEKLKLKRKQTLRTTF